MRALQPTALGYLGQPRKSRDSPALCPAVVYLRRDGVNLRADPFDRFIYMASPPMAYRAFSIARRKFTTQPCRGTNLLNARPGCTLVGSSSGKFTGQVSKFTATTNPHAPVTRVTTALCGDTIDCAVRGVFS